MKKLTLLVVCCLATTLSFAQMVVDSVYALPATKPTPGIDFKTKAITVGFLQGGGSLIGADLEVLLSPQLGIQGGMGLMAYGYGINYHFKPGVNTSFLSFSYWHQGLGTSFTQSMCGPSYVYRAKKIFTAQIGLAAVLKRGPAYPEDVEKVPMMLIYSVGLYFPI